MPAGLGMEAAKTPEVTTAALQSTPDKESEEGVTLKTGPNQVSTLTAMTACLKTNVETLTVGSLTIFPAHTNV